MTNKFDYKIKILRISDKDDKDITDKNIKVILKFPNTNN